MLFTRLPDKKYLLGIDLTDRFCQLSYLNTRRLAAGIDPHTFSYVTGREEFNIPAAAFCNPQTGEWVYGNEAYQRAADHGREPLTHLLALAAGEMQENANAQSGATTLSSANAQSGATTLSSANAQSGANTQGSANAQSGATKLSAENAQDGEYTRILIGFMKYCLSLLSVEVTAEEIEGVTFTTAVMDRSHARVLKMVADTLYPELDKISFEEHLKSFYHYVLMQDEEQRRQSILLVDGWSDAEIVLQSLSLNKKTRPIVCFPGERRLRVSADLEAAEKDRILYSSVHEWMQEKEFSAAYLTGEALGGGWMKDSLNLICRGRRAFQGDTLYSKGAAYSTMAACGLASRADKYFYLSSDALRCNVGMQCLKKGRTVYQALLDAGTEWYDAASQIDIILEDGDEIILQQTPVDSGNPREIAVKLENMPQRPKATTRLRVRLSMTAADRMRIEVEDMGFGEIFPSSGMKWEQEIAING